VEGAEEVPLKDTPSISNRKIGVVTFAPTPRKVSTPKKRYDTTTHFTGHLEAGEN
jgi:hypothetical protein